MTTWREHVASYRATHGGSYKEAMKGASSSWKARKAKKDESKGMKGKTKGATSKTHKGGKDFTTKKGDKDYHRGGKDAEMKKKPFTKKTRKVVGCGCGTVH
jgi:hypothetical protein